MQKIIYLDNGATTKPFKNSIEIASKYLEENYFNASSLYNGGVEAGLAISDARKSISSIFGLNFDVIFVSCGSEANNTAINSYLKRGNAVTTLGEHSAVYEPFNEFKKAGYDARFATLNADGSVNVENLLSLVDKNTVFVSVMHVNNETGAINDINYIARRVKEINPRIIFHADGVQAFLKIPYTLSCDIDLYSISAHKINALKGVGALIKNKRVKNLKPLIFGGGQESGLRSGTENIFGIKVFEASALTHLKSLKENYQNAIELKKYLLNGLDSSIFKIISSENCSPYIISVSAVGLRGEVLQHMLENYGIYVGTGSACSSKNRHSRVLKAIGYDEKVLDGVLRISFSSQTTLDEVKTAVSALNECANNLKRTMQK
ncbi:MAG: cysteine desulfurase [Clostridia bacterium]|nr:cysteine desulfurase [Clostridia bacterium]